MYADLYWNRVQVWRPSRSPDGFHRYLRISPMLGEGTEDFGEAGGLYAGVRVKPFRTGVNTCPEV